MANASAKKTASQNEVAVRNLHIGMASSIILSILFRFLLRRNSLLHPSWGLIITFLTTSTPSFVLYRYLTGIGTTKRNADGTLISSGEDLNQAGITEWCFDVIYITWACQIGSSLLGEWLWWLYAIIPLYAFYKLWTSFLGPMYFNRAKSDEAAEPATAEPTSKRQQKLKKREEKGDSRVKRVQVKR